MNCRASPPTAAGVFQLFHEECARAGTCLHVCNVRVCDIGLLPNSFASGKRFAVIPSRRTFAERGVGVQRRNGSPPSDNPGSCQRTGGGRRALTLPPAPVIIMHIHSHTHTLFTHTLCDCHVRVRAHTPTHTHARARSEIPTS